MRVDTNQPEIVATFRDMNCTVCHLHAVGRGVPDLLVGCRGINLLVECKTKTGVLNTLQREWHTNWKGQVVVCHSAREAADVVFAVWDEAGYLPYAPDQAKLNHTTKMIQALVARRSNFLHGERK